MAGFVNMVPSVLASDVMPVFVCFVSLDFESPTWAHVICWKELLGLCIPHSCSNYAFGCHHAAAEPHRVGGHCCTCLLDYQLPLGS